MKQIYETRDDDANPDLDNNSRSSMNADEPSALVSEITHGGRADLTPDDIRSSSHHTFTPHSVTQDDVTIDTHSNNAASDSTSSSVADDTTSSAGSPSALTPVVKRVQFAVPEAESDDDSDDDSISQRKVYEKETYHGAASVTRLSSGIEGPGWQSSVLTMSSESEGQPGLQNKLLQDIMAEHAVKHTDCDHVSNTSRTSDQSEDNDQQVGVDVSVTDEGERTSDQHNFLEPSHRDISHPEEHAHSTLDTKRNDTQTEVRNTCTHHPLFESGSHKEAASQDSSSDGRRYRCHGNRRCYSRCCCGLAWGAVACIAIVAGGLIVAVLRDYWFTEENSFERRVLYVGAALCVLGAVCTLMAGVYWTRAVVAWNPRPPCVCCLVLAGQKDGPPTPTKYTISTKGVVNEESGIIHREMTSLNSHVSREPMRVVDTCYVECVEYTESKWDAEH